MRATHPIPIAAVSVAALTLGLVPGVALATPASDPAPPASAVASSAVGTVAVESAAARRAVVKVKGWTRLSAGKISILSQPNALPLDTGGTEAVWYQEDGPNSDSIRARVVLENGKPGSGIVPVVTGWATLIDDPKIINYGSKRMVVFGGIRSTSAGEKFTGPMAFATSTNGTSWTLGNGSLTHTGYAYGSYGTAAVDDGGTPLVAVDASSSSYVTLHRGVDPSVPAGAPDWTTSTTTGYGLHVGLARDSETGQVWAAWYCLGCSKSQDGVLAQRVWPKPIGALKHAPKSSTKGDSLNPQQAVAVASRKGGGVYAAYKVGYPVANKIRIWRVGTKDGFNVKTKDADHISLLTGPGGRLWLVWDSDGGSKVKVVRTNKKVTRVGVVRTYKPPKKKGDLYNPVWATGGSGSGGPLHLLINSQMGTRATQIWYRKVLPGLRLVVSPRKLGSGKIVATVTDAGKAVAGAVVKFHGKKKTTHASGKVTFKVGKGVASGKYKLKAKKAGFAKGLAVVKVT